MLCVSVGVGVGVDGGVGVGVKPPWRGLHTLYIVENKFSTMQE